MTHDSVAANCFLLSLSQHFSFTNPPPKNTVRCVSREVGFDMRKRRIKRSVRSEEKQVTPPHTNTTTQPRNKPGSKSNTLFPAIFKSGPKYISDIT